MRRILSFVLLASLALPGDAVGQELFSFGQISPEDMFGGFDGSINQVSDSGDYFFRTLSPSILQENGSTIFMYEDGGTTVNPQALLQVFDSLDAVTQFTVNSIGWRSFDGKGTLTGFSGGIDGTEAWQLSGIYDIDPPASQLTPTTGSYATPIDTIVWDVADYTQGTFGYTMDNLNINIGTDPPEPSPIFYQDNAPPSSTTDFNVFLEQMPDPLDAENTVGLITMGGTANYVNVNSGPELIDVSAFEGQKFRAAFDYLVPTDTAFDANDTFWVQVGFNDPVSGGNSGSAGFPATAAVADGTWRTIELTGIIPADTNGANFLVVMTDDGFVGGSPNTFGDVMFIDNLIFEAVEVLPGDFNGDGAVDMVDYAVWRDNLGTPAPSEPYAYGELINASGERVINFAGDGQNGVDMGDYAVWKSNFGATAGSVSLLASGTTVPEPSAIAICACGLVVASWRRRAARRREVLA